MKSALRGCTFLVAPSIVLLFVSNSDAWLTSSVVPARDRIAIPGSRQGRSRVPRMMAGPFPGDYDLAPMSKALAKVVDTLSGIQQSTVSQISSLDVKFQSSVTSIPGLKNLPTPFLSALSRPLEMIDASNLAVDPSGFYQWLSTQGPVVLGDTAMSELNLKELATQASQALDAVVATYPAFAGPLDHLRMSLSHSLESLQQAYLAGTSLIPEQYQAVVTILVVGTVSTAFGISLGEEAEARKLQASTRPTPTQGSSLPLRYDLPAIMDYYNRRPLTLLGRLFEVSSQLGSLALKLWIDRNVGDGNGWEKNMQSRAEEFLEFVQGAGPAFIKIGQGISIRPDILPETYLRELSKLQDRVKPFDSGDARRILREKLSKPLSEIFLDADTAFETPVAAASLGQVYRATLLDGEQVAVKVQRPDVLQSVTLDLYVIRLLLLFASKWDLARDSALSVLGVIDNWADRFIQELDYIQEAANGDRFRTEMAASKTLGEAIVVPQVYIPLTSRYTLVTEWIEGVKVDAIELSTPGGRERLNKIVATLLNSYLAQLLESGFLHADPHPGNFLCTPDGRLCVLDMGLMTEVNENERYGLLEYVSHLSAKDYGATLDDLITLGFIPKEIGEDPKKAAIVAPLLATVLEQLSNGGGAKSVTVESVGEEIEELGKQYPIVIPPYFGLIIRAFSALEGLGLRLDPQYSIVKESFPYLARRLLTEDSPRMHKMLRTFLYGKEGRYLQVDRVDELVDGYSKFTALADEASKGVSVDGVKNPLGHTAAEDAAALIPATATPGFVDASSETQFESPASSRVMSNSASTSSQRLRRARSALAASAPGGDSRDSDRRFGTGTATASAVERPPMLASGFAGMQGNVDGMDASGRLVDPVQDPVARDALKLLFAKEGNYVQELIVEELVRMTDALSREANLQIIQALRELTEAPLSPARIARALAEAPLNPFLAPLQIPVKAQTFALKRIFGRLEVALELTQEDEESLKAVRRLQQLVLDVVGGSSSGDERPASPLPFPLPGLLPVLTRGGLERDGGASTIGPREAVDAARKAAAIAGLIGPGLVSISQKFLVQLSVRTLDRLADSLEEQGSTSPLGQRRSSQTRSRFYDEMDP